ncbi:histidine phosphatase family protein [Streptomyces sp. NPDC056441]|uniref:histidine phosphatase family protein n=1 Tax=Streptomyces sp. NPDC056441 TaxID=3345817 RepID=UPI0036A4029E
MSAAKCIQLDRFHRQHQRLLRVRAAEDRCLDLPLVPRMKPHLSYQLIVSVQGFAPQPINGFTPQYAAGRAGLRGTPRSRGGSRPTARGAAPARRTWPAAGSDLQRTLRTAQEVAELFGVKSVLDRRLREKSYGEAEGMPQEWLDRRFVPPPAVGERMEHDEGVEDAETKAACAQRIYEAMDEILPSPCEHQIIGTHSGSLTCVVASWIKMPMESASYASFRAPSGSITTLREGDIFHNCQVVSLGDTRHLDSAKVG